MSESDEPGNKLIKNKLAVFEHVPCKEKDSSKKPNFRKRMNRSLSPVSDTDLVIDDDDYTSTQPQKKRNIGVRFLEEPLNMCCGWKNCSLVFNEYRRFMQHLEEHACLANVLEPFACSWEHCKYCTTSDALIRQHVFFHGYHSRLINIGANVVERVELPSCNQAYEFVVPEEPSGYACEWYNCGSVFNSVYEFYEHIRQHVNSNPKYCKNGEIIQCLWKGCNYKCDSQYKLKDHLKSHTKEKIVACPTCGNMFASKTKLYDHRKRQLPIEMQSYQCSQCSKLFPTERLLRDHMRSHINHYKCTMCDMTCSKPSALATHIRFRHLPDRPLKCNFCEHTCVSRQTLESHLMTHCSQKLFACEECDFRCRSLSGLDSHYQKVHNQGWSPVYECHCCQEKFSRGNQLTKHLIKEHDYHWPSGHSRFRYKEDTDGIFRLQTVRYESIEVTQEMMRTNRNQQLSEESGASKYNLMKCQQSLDKTPNYVLMIAENGEQNVVCPTENNIEITINDLDESGNIVNSEVLESNEMKVMDSSKSSSTPAEEGRSLKFKKNNKS